VSYTQPDIDAMVDHGHGLIISLS